MKKYNVAKIIMTAVVFIFTFAFMPFNSFADGDEGETLTRLGAGLASGHSAIVQPDGSLLMWGDGRDGQLGFESYQESLPKLASKNVKYVALGYRTTAIIKKDGTLWTAGLNDNGQLGIGTISEKHSKFTKILDNVSFVTFGAFHGLAVKKDGSLWAWGNNEYGAFCNGTTTSSLTPVKVMNSGVKYAHAGRLHTEIVKTDGRVFACGYNFDGQLGLGYSSWNPTYYVATPQEVVFLDKTDPEHPRRIEIKQVAPGDESTIFLLEDNTLWFVGDDNHGDSCLGDDFYLSSTPVKITDNVRLARKGWDNTSFVTNDNKVFMCGYNDSGEVGIGERSYGGKYTPQATHIGPVQDVLTGGSHSLAITLDGSLYCWGYNGWGECGLGYQSSQYVDHIYTPTQVKLPIGVPEGHTLEFNGKQQVGVEPGVGYTLTKNKGKKVGNYTAIAKLAKDYTWTDGTKEAKRIKWKIVKGTNPLQVAPKTVTAKYKKVKKQDVFAPRKKVITIIKKGIGNVTYQKAKGHKKFEVEKNEGSLKIGQGLKQGNYVVKIKVTAKGNENYKAGTKTIAVPVVIE